MDEKLNENNAPADTQKPDKGIIADIRQRLLVIAENIGSRIKNGAPPDPEFDYSSFKKDRKKKYEFPVYRAEDVYDNYSYQQFDKVHDCIIEVDFSRLPRFTDIDQAHTNLVVLASDGSKGTLSHLTLPQTEEDQKISIQRFVEKLAKYWNKKVPVCLAGGADNNGDKFIGAIKEALAAQGFIIFDSDAHNSLGGTGLYRNCILCADKVIVRIKDHNHPQPVTPVTLTFPVQY